MALNKYFVKELLYTNYLIKMHACDSVSYTYTNDAPYNNAPIHKIPCESAPVYKDVENAPLQSAWRKLTHT
jgi:hypothetical protein